MTKNEFFFFKSGFNLWITNSRIFFTTLNFHSFVMWPLKELIFL